MNENLNLCEILKGHEGEIFYSPILGDLKLINISNNGLVLDFKSESNPKIEVFSILKNGKLVNGANEIAVYPSKDQSDWNKWVEEQKYKISKTWSQYLKNNTIQPYVALINTKADTPIEKSALALLKIYLIIEVGYSGYPTKEDYDKANYERLWTVRIYKTDDNDFIFGASPLDGECFKNNIAFHTIEQANEFISYPENIQLLKDYFMINK